MAYVSFVITHCLRRGPQKSFLASTCMGCLGRQGETTAGSAYSHVGLFCFLCCYGQIYQYTHSHAFTLPFVPKKTLMGLI
jgi:hypothetical protein